MRTGRHIFAAGCCLFLLAHAVCGQETSTSADKTLLEIEILAPTLTTDPLAAQKWRQVFEQVGEGVRIRQPLGSDQPSLTEVSRGPFRIIRMTGTLDRKGNVTFPGKTFSPQQVEQLKEWFNELRVYGQQGSPEGKPLWGLSEDQFKSLMQQLSQPVIDPVQGLTFSAALDKIPLGNGLETSYHSSAEDLRRGSVSNVIKDEVQGLTAGTALAYLLSQQGLAFRPLRTPSGAIQLVVQARGEISDPWPVGWPVDESRPRNELVPGLFKTVETGVTGASLQAVVNAIEEKTDVRILLDAQASKAKGIDPEQVQVSYPRKYTSWALILSSVCVSSHLTMTYRQDERGTGFIYLAPFASYQPKPTVKQPAKPLPGR